MVFEELEMAKGFEEGRNEIILVLTRKVVLRRVSCLLPVSLFAWVLRSEGSLRSRKDLMCSTAVCDGWVSYPSFLPFWLNERKWERLGLVEWSRIMWFLSMCPSYFSFFTLAFKPSAELFLIHQHLPKTWNFMEEMSGQKIVIKAKKIIKKNKRSGRIL